MRSKIVYAAISAFVLIADRAIKRYVMIIPGRGSGVFAVHLNNSFAWGAPASNTIVLGLALAVLVLLIAWMFYSLAARSSAGPWLILAGALSNVIDRATVGGVIDYLALPWGGRINIADISIIAGVIILLKK